MAFRDIAERIEYPAEVSSRYKKLDAFERLLEGRFYSHLPYSWSTEYDSGNMYVRQESRRPAVIYNLAKIIVTLTAGLTFGKSHAPHLKCPSRNGSAKYASTQDAISQIIEPSYSRIFQKMLGASIRGSVGSCALIVRALPNGKPFISVVSGKNARPMFSPRDPTNLLGLVQQMPVSRDDLLQMGYEEDEVEDEGMYWLRITLDKYEEVWYKPILIDTFSRLRKMGFEYTWDNDAVKKPKWVPDKKRSGPHGFGIVPAVWCRNLEETELMDGPCTFGDVVDICVDIDYKFSQISRGITYAGDPLLVINRGEMAYMAELGGQRDIVKGAGQPLVLGKEEEATLLEMSGKGLEGAREYIKMLREYALEVMGGFRSDAQHAGGTQSGVALDRLFYALEWLVDRQRVAYGDDVLIPLVRVILVGVERSILLLPEDVGTIDPDAPIQEVWPEKRIPKGADLAQTINAIQGMAGGSTREPVQLLPEDLTTALAAMSVGITDTEGVVEQMRSEREEKMQEELEQEQQQMELDAKLKAQVAAAGSSNNT